MRFLYATLIFFSMLAQAQNIDDAQIVLNTGGHLASVKSIDFSADGKLLFSISDDKTVRVWNIEREECIKTYRGYAERGRVGMLNSGLITPDREILAVGGFLGHGDEDQGEIRLMNSHTGEIVFVLRGHPSPVISLGCTPEEDYLASGSTDGSIGIWSLNSGKGIKLSGHNDEVYATEFSPDGQNLLTASYDSTAIIWNFREMLETGEPEVTVLDKQEDKIRCAAYSPDGKYIVTAGEDEKLLLYDAEGNFIKTLIHLDDNGIQSLADIHSISFSDDSKVMVIGTRLLSGANAISYSFPEGNVLHEFKGNDNTVIATAMYGNRLVATAGGSKRDIYVWDAYTGEIKAHLVGDGQRVFKVATTPNNQLALGFKQQDTPRVNNFGRLSTSFDLNSLQLTSSDNGFEAFESGSMTWSGKQIYHTGLYTLTVLHEDYTESIIEVDPGTEGAITCFSFTPNGNVAIGSNFDLTLYSTTGEYLKSFRGHVADVYSLAFDAERNFMFSASADNTTKIWDLSLEGKREIKIGEFEMTIRDRYGDEAVDGMIVKEGDNWLTNFYHNSYPKRVLPKATLFVSANQD